MNGRDTLAYLSLKYHGDWDKMVSAIKRHEDCEAEGAEEQVRAIPSSFVTLVDAQYPESFKHAIKPPLVFYYYGNLSLLDDEKNCVAYIGSREASPYGARMAKQIAGDLAKRDYVVVTGLARGIDAIATEAALAEHGKVIAILGSGIDLCYPSSSLPLYEKLKKEGLVISEYPLKTPPVPDNFPKRNRMVAASCKGIVVGQASKKSGTLVTISFALGLTKEVGCLPYPADEESACNLLIKEGANLIENADDVDLMMGKTSP
jgi:DNA processing protein